MLERMNKMDIHGARVFSPKVYPDERGVVRKVVTSNEFQLPIRDVYCTSVYKDIVKGWHGYKTKTICFTCIYGCIKFVLYDPQTLDKESIIIGTDNYKAISVPPGVFSAFKGIAPFSEVVVVADEMFTESGMIRVPIEAIDYDWRTKNG
jgi:dTDP-4-dehydrorhamnose 3,5-epimerase-like enzyme